MIGRVNVTYGWKPWQKTCVSEIVSAGPEAIWAATDIGMESMAAQTALDRIRWLFMRAAAYGDGSQQWLDESGSAGPS